MRIVRLMLSAQGYFLGAFLFLGIVFALPVALGSAALALDLPVSNDEALGGLVFPAAAYVLDGKAGLHFSSSLLNLHLVCLLCPLGTPVRFPLDLPIIHPA